MLEITYSKKIKYDIDQYYGKPMFCKILITDVEGGKYSVEFQLPKKWDQGKFTEMIYESFKLCDNTPKSVHIDELRVNTVDLN